MTEAAEPRLWSAGDLRAVLKLLSVDASSCVEREDFVGLLTQVPARELKEALNRRKIDASGCAEKGELLARLLKASKEQPAAENDDEDDEDEAPLEPGSIVRLVDLRSAPALNMQRATIVRYDEATERYEVRLDFDGSIKRIRPENLDVLEEAEAAPSKAESQPAPADAQAAENALEPGVLVRIVNLQGAASLNGKLAKVDKHDCATGRYVIRLVEDGCIKSVKAENLRVECEAEREVEGKKEENVMDKASQEDVDLPKVDVVGQSEPQVASSEPCVVAALNQQAAPPADDAVVNEGTAEGLDDARMESAPCLVTGSPVVELTEVEMHPPVGPDERAEATAVDVQPPAEQPVAEAHDSQDELLSAADLDPPAADAAAIEEPRPSEGADIQMQPSASHEEVLQDQDVSMSVETVPAGEQEQEIQEEPTETAPEPEAATSTVQEDVEVPTGGDDVFQEPPAPQDQATTLPAQESSSIAGVPISVSFTRTPATDEKENVPHRISLGTTRKSLDMSGVSPAADGRPAKKPMKLKMGTVAGREVEKSGRMAEGVQALFLAREYFDVRLICGEASFGAHTVVLAGQSSVFRDMLKEKSELLLQGISQPEAVQLMLEFLYEIGDESGYAPSLHEVNKDVLSLSEQFALPKLKRRAAVFMARDITTKNAMERLNTCDTFNLPDIRERILDQLASSKRALAEFTGSPAATTHPHVLQDVLRRVTTTPTEGGVSPASKRARKSL